MASARACLLGALAFGALAFAHGQTVWQTLGKVNFKYSPGRDLTWQDLQVSLGSQSSIQLASGCARASGGDAWIHATTAVPRAVRPRAVVPSRLIRPQGADAAQSAALDGRP